MFYVFVLVCFSCVVCFHFIELIRIILFLCCCFCHKTKWSSWLHLVVLLPFLFFVVLFWIFLFFVFSFLSKKIPPKPDTAKNPKNKNAEKTDQKKNQSAQLCSQIVFFIFWGGLKNFIFGWKHYKKSGCGTFFKKEKGRKVTKLLSWKSVQLCCAT